MVCWATFVHNALKGERQERKRGEEYIYEVLKLTLKSIKSRYLYNPPPRQHHFNIKKEKKIYIVFSYFVYVSGFHDTKL